jgi:hypothetical protein
LLSQCFFFHLFYLFFPLLVILPPSHPCQCLHLSMSKYCYTSSLRPHTLEA